MGKFSEVDDMVHLSLTFRRIILVPLSLNFNEDSFVMDTQPYVRIEFGKYQRSAYFFPLTRGQLDSLCISVNVPWNSGIISFLGF
ncbi:Thymidylate synthase [Trichinella spiralis]|uniref:Thymidylate synthase n=1 Tax=Trichinella spiralis TaxID=6334 RepID=A0ABR3KWW0_TRISP